MFDSGEPSIGYIQRKLGETGARAVVSYMIADALQFFNVRETMNDRQVALTVDLILEEYPYLQTDDVKLCLRNAMKLKYGDVYNRIDGTTIMRWFSMYNKERCSEADEQSYNEAYGAKYNTSSPNAITRDEYIRLLRDRANSGDIDAEYRLDISLSVSDYINKIYNKW